MDEFENLIAGSMLEKQIAGLIQEDRALDAINTLWPQVLEDPESLVLNRLLGVAYLFHGNVENAKLYLSKAIEIDPTDSMSKYYLSELIPS